MEYRLRRHDGEYRWILDNAAPLFDTDGTFAGYIGTCIDVTEFRRAETERGVATDRLRLAMEAGKSIGWERDLRTDQATWFGDLSTVLGLPSNLHVGHIDDFRGLIHPDDRGMFLKRLADAADTRSPYAAEFRILPNGTQRWLAAKGEFYYSRLGEPERMLGVAMDITERKDAEESLRRKERELKEAQRLAGVGSWEWHRATDTVVWSEELYRIAGRDPSLPAVSYKDHSRLYTAESMDRLRDAVAAALDTDAPYELDLEMIHADGTHRWVTARGEAQRDAAGQMTGLRGTVQDITERKLVEEALSGVNGRLIEAQESERGRIARDLHDDIGQRLAMLAMTQAQLQGLVNGSPGSEAAACLKALQSQTAEIIADVQTLSHQLHPPRLLHLGFVAAMRGFCEELSAQKSAAVHFRHEHVPASVPPDVSLCLFRVLQEALQNAVRHSGVRQFDVHIRGTESGVDLAVRDQGVGFDVRTANHGLGLGLTSMRERLKLVGGELFIESRSTRGTTVLARAPIKPVQ